LDTDRNQIILATENRLLLESVRDLLVKDSKSGAYQPRSVEIGFSQITGLEFSPDRKSLLIAGGDPGQNGCVECLDWPSANRRIRVETYKDGLPITDVATDVHWFPSGSRWIEAHWSGDVLVRALDGSQVSRFTGHSGIVLSAIPWGEDIAISCGIDQTIKIWKVADGEQIRSLDNHTAAVTELLRWTSPEGQHRLISIGRDRTIRLWDPLIGRLIRFVKLKSIPTAIDFSGPESLMVLLDDGRLSRVSLPSLAIEDSDASVAAKGTTMLQIAPGVWRCW
jgi:WD40 repeat protein